MKVFVTGTRGFPRIMGGVETHCQELYTRLAARGVDVTVARRKPYLNDTNSMGELDGVKFCDIAAPRSKYFEAIVHTFRSLFKARRSGAEILHIHNIGPGLVTPLARLMGMKVVLTVHSFNYDHKKWNALAKGILRLGEWVSTRFANSVICISDPIKNSLTSRYKGLHVDRIYNGVSKPHPTQSHSWLEKWGIGQRPYILAVGRITPEKGYHDLLEAWRRSGLAGSCDLVIAGDTDHPTPYADGIKADARRLGVVMPGVVRGEQLWQLYSHASLFALPSYNEGLPIAMLEAMSYGLDIVASDIEPNRIGLLPDEDYFPLGDVDAMAAMFIEHIASPAGPKTYDLSAFDWDNIADSTLEVYRRLSAK